MRTSRLTIATLLVSMGCGRCDPASRASPSLAPDVIVTAVPTASAPEGGLCARVRGDNTLALARAAYGDLLVLRFDVGYGFRDHAEVAERARKAGAERAEPTIAAEAYILSKVGLVMRTTAGLTAPVLGAMAGYLASGRLPQQGSQIEVVLSHQDAQHLGLELGSEFTLAARDPASPDSAPVAQRGVLVGTFAADGLFGGDRSAVWMTFAGATRLHREYQNGAATSIAVYLPKGGEAAALRDRLDRELGPSYRILTAHELQAPLVQHRADLLAICAEAPAASRQASPLPQQAIVTPCGARAEEPEKLARGTFGEASLVFEPNDGIALESQPWLPPGDKRWGVASSGVLATDAGALGADVAGLDTATLKTLEGQLEAGSLDRLADGGVAISDIMAATLGVGVASEVVIAARMFSLSPATAGLAIRRLRVEAVLAYPQPSLSRHEPLVLMHRDQAALFHPELGKGKGNALRIWAVPGGKEAVREALAVAPPDASAAELGAEAEANISDTVRVLEALCRR